MNDYRNDKENEDLEFLKELIEATRADEPTDAQWHSAQRRLAETLGAAAAQPGRGFFDALRAFVWRKSVALAVGAVAVFFAIGLPVLITMSSVKPAFADTSMSTPGELVILGVGGSLTTATCPLKHTHVEANITGFVSRTIVKQTFTNPYDTKIEAEYMFPLPHDSAVDSMVMLVGGRRIVGKVRERQEARQIYNTARAAGHVAGLLDQERPNIFTQTVANIEPGAQVEIEISYVETLKSNEGVFEYVFPMVVAPRYNPGAQMVHVEGKTATLTNAAPIHTATNAPSVRAGHDIDVSIFLDAGSEIFDLQSKLHEVEVDKDTANHALVSLKNKKQIPNKDFVLSYRTADKQIASAFISNTTPLGSFFTLDIQPPVRVEPQDARPKEMIFVIDRSGSMSGQPIEKAKETMSLCIEKMNPNDTFNLLSFSGGTGKCFEKPMANTPENRTTAQDYLKGLNGSGGTEMMPAIMEALGRPADPSRVRIVCFMTDGEIGNDFEIIDAVKKNVATSRVFAFGIGQSVNRFLLSAMAREGRGEVDFVTLNESGATAAQRFHDRIGSPVLTDISVDWNGLPVADVYPKLIPDLFSRKPIMLHGRLTGPASGEITLRGNTAIGPYERKIRIAESNGPERRDALDTLWARAKVEHLMNQDLRAVQAGTFPTELRDEITSTGVEYGIMTQFTSFVAVDESVVTSGSGCECKKVATEMPEGQTDGIDVLADETMAANFGLFDSKAPTPTGTRNSGQRSLALGFEAYNTDVPLSAYASGIQPQKAGVKKVGGTYGHVLLYAGDAKEPMAGRGFIQLENDAYQYDPSNGTVSPGDVWRVQQGAGAAAPQHFYGDAVLPSLQSAQATATHGSSVAARLPDVVIGDNDNDIGADNNFFVLTNAFKFDDYASDGDTTVSSMLWSFDEGGSSSASSGGGAANYFQVNGRNAMRASANTTEKETPASKNGEQTAALSSGSMTQNQDSIEALDGFATIAYDPTNGSVSPSGIALGAYRAGVVDPDLGAFAAKVVTDGKDGDYTSGTLTAKGWMVHCYVTIGSVGDDLLKQLRTAGFTPDANSVSSTRQLEGTLDVRKIAEVVNLGFVVRISTRKS